MTSRPARNPWVVTLILSLIAIGIGAATFVGIGAVLLTMRGPHFILSVVTVAGCGLLALTILVILGWPQLMAAERSTRKEYPRMSAITGNEPAHWHDEHGHHRMKDPRTIPGWDWENKSGDWSDGDERAFTAHLIAHEHLDEFGEPLADDPPEVRMLLDQIKLGHTVIAKQVELVRIIRHRYHHDITAHHEDNDER